MNSIFVADFETRNFTFQAFGDTPETAVAALIETWKDHCRRRQANADLPLEYRGDIMVREVFLGKGYTDGEPDSSGYTGNGDHPRFDAILKALADG